MLSKAFIQESRKNIMKAEFKVDTKLIQWIIYLIVTAVAVVAITALVKSAFS